MALGLVPLVVAVLTTMSGYILPSVDIPHEQSVDGTTLPVLVMIVTSLCEFHYSGRWKSNACRR
jgi:hypothetical protein